MWGDKEAGHVPSLKGQQCKCPLSSKSSPVCGHGLCPPPPGEKHELPGPVGPRVAGDAHLLSWRTRLRPTVSMAVELASGCGAALCSAPEPDVSKPSHTRAALPGPMGLRRIVVLSSTVSLWCQRDRHGVVVLDAEHVVTQTGKRV